jgi:hypothetical protein
VDYNAIRVEECNQHFFLNYVKKKKLKDWTDQFIKVFVDDININHNYCNDHLDHLKMLFEKLKIVKF